MSKFKIYDEAMNSWLSLYQQVSVMYAENVRIRGHHSDSKTYKIDCLVLGQFLTESMADDGPEVKDERETLAKFTFVLSEALIHEDCYELIIKLDDNKTANVRIYSPITNIRLFLIGLSKLSEGSYTVEQRNQRMIAMAEITLC